MGREYNVLTKLHAAYPTPRPLLYCTDEQVLGAPFYVMERVRGIILRRNLPAGLTLPQETARKLSESFIDNLADLHRLDYQALGLGELGKPQGYLERQVRGWMERYQGSKTHELPEVEPLSSWLRENMPSHSDATLIHNDYKFDNMVLDSADITRIKAVLDWEMCTLGDPLTDLGTALPTGLILTMLRRCRWCDGGQPLFRECSGEQRWHNATLRRQAAIFPILFSIMFLPCSRWR